MTPIIYINGSFLPEAEAMINVDDGGWLHGAGLFETTRAEDGRVFCFHRHIERLRRSAAVILRPLDIDALPDETVVTELLRRNDLPAARLRLTVSAGPVRQAAEDGPPPLTVCLAASPLIQYAPALYEKGVQVVICPHRVSPSDPIAGHKTTSYLPRLIGLRNAQRAGALDALWFTTNNHLAEGCISSAFIVTGGVLRTSPLDTPVLPGIARGVTLELAREAGIEAREESLTIDDLLDADEVFLTNAIMHIMPVIRVEKHDIKRGRVGVITQKLMDAFRGLVRRS